MEGTVLGAKLWLIEKKTQRCTTLHCDLYHRYRPIWYAKCRFKVLQGPLCLWVWDICWQLCAQDGVEIIKGVLSSNHVHLFVSDPGH